MENALPENALPLDVLAAAGLPAAAISAWAAAHPRATSDFTADVPRHAAFWAQCTHLLDALPGKPKRNLIERDAAASIFTAARRTREHFLGAHTGSVYDGLTDRRARFVRVDQLVRSAATLVPGLVPTEQELQREAALDQRDKDGVEIDQGIFLAHVLGREDTGLHLCHAMLLPRPESAALAERFAADGVLDLGAARVERRGNSVHLTASNPRFLNAEDETTLTPMEIAVDVATLDTATGLGVLRGAAVDRSAYRGRAVFGAGINLTHLYRGRISFLWFLERELGYVHKLMRGVARDDSFPDDVRGCGIEKPWVAVVDAFAIGGHCQLLLCMDYVLAAADAFMTLPARKEGIIPGVANLRLPRFTGDRIARQAIQYGRRLDCDSPEGRLVCDEVVPAADIDAALDRVLTGLGSSGVVSAVGNRRALRVCAEPLDVLRRYCSVYAREQASCLFSPALIANLEQHWNAQHREV
ncbi:MAG TPA: enoyl-CoA hydratase/isomerase family protein [Burkholderiaceae bacterium]|nr:enoyl-CoA hydratase/isomerase family protein [Burkholderiaceae bacterium]